jgi:Ca-activated chloride channel family protein
MPNELMKPQLHILSERSALPTEVPAGQTLLVSIQVPQIEPGLGETATPTKGVNLALALDRSGSMGGQGRMQQAKRAAHELIDQLSAGDQLSVVTFGSGVEVLATAVPGHHRELLHDLIETVRVSGQTHLHGGWLAAAQEVAAHYRQGYLNRVILVSDGMANRGLCDTTQVAEHVASLSRTGVSTTTLGVGMNFNEGLLEAMAEAGDGNYHYAPTAEQMPLLFQEELQEQRLVVGSRAKFRVVQRACGVRVLAPLNQLREEPQGCYQLGNLVAGKNQKLVFDVIVPQDLPTDQPLLTVELEWRDAEGSAQAVTCEWSLPRVAEAVYSNLSANQEVVLERSLLKATQHKRLAAEALDRRQLFEALDLFEKALVVLEPVAQHAAAQRMMASLKQLRTQAREGQYAHSSKQAKYESSRHRRKGE